jgi:hypothetical protein
MTFAWKSARLDDDVITEKFPSQIAKVSKLTLVTKVNV